MKTVSFFATLALGLCLASCGGDGAEKSDGDGTSSTTGTTDKGGESGGSALLANPAKPADLMLQRTNAAGASFELPTGTGWTREGDRFHHDDWGMTIVVQSQADGMRDMKKEYLESYNDNNIRDAQGWNRGPETFGTVAGVDGARIGGTFDNGTPHITRDYVYFDKAKTVILQARVIEKNKEKLQPVVDYIATTYK